MKKLIFLAIVLIAHTLVNAQTGTLEKANRYFNLLSYDKAIILYESLLGSKVDNSQLKAKLAQSYLFVNQVDKAVEKYAEAFSLDNSLSVEHNLYYAQSLKSLGRYAESDQWMAKYNEQKKGSLIADNYVKNKDYLEKINSSEKHFTIGNVAFNSSKSDFGGYNFSKGNSLFFISSRGFRPVQWKYGWNGDRFLDLYNLKLTESAKAQKPKRIKNTVNSRYHEGPICFNADESMVYFTRNNLSSGKLRRDAKGIQNLTILIAEVDDEGNWINIKSLKINSKDYSVGHPSISKDGKTLYFASDMPGGFGGADLYKATILEDGNLGAPINLGKTINTEGQEMFPWIAPNGQLFFASNGLMGLGGLDNFVAELDEQGNVTNYQHCGKEINSSMDDFGLSFMPDGKTGYFSSNRTDGLGGDDIYTFNLIKPFIFKLVLSGQVADKDNKEILPGTLIQLLDENDKVIGSVTADEKGRYAFNVDPGKVYKLKFSDPLYDNLAIEVPVKQASGAMIIDAELSKKPDFGILCLVNDAVDALPLEGVTVLVKEKKTGKILLSNTTEKEGAVNAALENVKIGDKMEIEITVSKGGYLTKTDRIILTVDRPGTINLHEKMNVNLSKLDVGMDLATLIDIKPIYFDLGKSVIRKDAAVELDKIIKVMNEYPTMVVELGSHTDCRGSIASNAKLSDNRAKASAEYIKKKITNPQRISGKGYGESKLIINCPCEGTVKSTCPETEHQKNRRTEFIIIKM